MEQVWKALIDVEHVAPCLPGAAVTGQNDDGTYNGTFTIKIGPTTASYAGKLAMEQVDEAAHSAIMQANGTDKRGQGGAKATIVSTLSETEGGTRVEVNTDYHITGRLARFGRGGMIEDISQRLLREFAERLAESLKAGNVNERAAEAAATEAAEAAATEAAEGAATEAAEPAVAESVAQQPPTALDAGAVARSVLAERIRRNPIPLALIAGFLLAILLRRRAR
jgi:carbon monoxide dehydrogenase subunit G